MNRVFTWQELLQALTVDVIRRLWDSDQYRDNKWLILIHDNWLDIWTDWKTDLTMRDVDRQIEEMFLESEITPHSFTEELEGETPLGGEMRLQAPYMDREEL